MNGNQLHPGHDYAWVRWPQRKPGTYYPDATRLRVIRVLSVEVPGFSKRRTYVEVEFLQSDGTSFDPAKYRTVRGGQIVYQWKEHAEMHERREAKRRENEARRERMQEEYRLREEERTRAVREANEPIYKLFEDVGVPRDYVSITTYQVAVSKSTLLEAIRREQNTV